MTTLYWIILATFIISLISFIGALTLFLKERILNRVLLILVAFSAGALVGDVFFHLLPEVVAATGVEEGPLLRIFLYLIFGFCAFFILEQFLSWHHHHAVQHPEVKSFSYLILASDGLHNFIDGLIIAGSFLTSFPIGLATSLAVVFHEIPQEIGNFAVLVYGGMKKGRALLLNFISAITAILGGVIGFLVFKNMEGGILCLLAFTAGSFIYIAASDLIPEIKNERDIKKSIVHFSAFLVGIALMLLIKS
ncbi:MAG: ZIP family metal transporter [Candidatus Paceibacterota bacterium]